MIELEKENTLYITRAQIVWDENCPGFEKHLGTGPSPERIFTVWYLDKYWLFLYKSPTQNEEWHRPNPIIHRNGWLFQRPDPHVEGVDLLLTSSVPISVLTDCDPLAEEKGWNRIYQPQIRISVESFDR